jgi:hypothetical protein
MMVIVARATQQPDQRMERLMIGAHKGDVSRDFPHLSFDSGYQPKQKPYMMLLPKSLRVVGRFGLIKDTGSLEN